MSNSPLRGHVATRSIIPLLVLSLGSSGKFALAAKAVPTLAVAIPATTVVNLVPNSLRNPQLWRGVDDQGTAEANQASWQLTGNHTMLVKGAIATPLAIGPLQNATLHASLRFRVPENCVDYTSVSLAFYGDSGPPAYTIVIFKNPGAPVGQGVLRVSGDSALTLTPGSWHTLQLDQVNKSASIKVWTDGQVQPKAPQWTGTFSNTTVTKVGVRVYGDPVEVSDFDISAVKQKPPELNRALLPQPVFDAKPDFVKLYYVAWDQAFAHVKTGDGIPQSPYMDEACYDSAIWIWDTCFMSLFTRYSPEQFPCIQSLSNFYAPAYDGAPTKLDIWFADNPPLFAWAEHDNFAFSGDKARLRWLLEDKQYLQKHYQWFQTPHPDQRVSWAKNGLDLKPQPLGFEWSGQHDGMDNTPRFKVKGTLGIDAIAQQGLAALYISKLADQIDDQKLSAQWMTEYNRVKDLVNQHYWDEKDGFYYDLLPDGKSFSKVRTPASFWPVLAGMATPQQTARMAQYLRDPKELGGFVPWVTLSHSDPDFNAATGDYWRGSMWLPTAYMGIRALEENGQAGLADSSAEAVLTQMSETYKNYEPHTIWECYNPNKNEPATEHGQRVRPDFCGWSALGPISLFIENVLGFYDVDATKNTVSWRLHQAGRHGIENLRFGKTTTDIVTDGAGHIDVKSNQPYSLNVNGHLLRVKKGAQRFSLPMKG